MRRIFIIICRKMKPLLKSFIKHFKNVIIPIKILDTNKELPYDSTINIDLFLSKVQLFSREINSLELNNDFRGLTKIYLFSLFIQIFNAIRNLLYCFLPNNERLLIWFGDITQYSGNKRQFILIPLFSFSFIGSLVQILILKSPLKQLQ